MDRNALALEHGAVSGVLHQRVLEGVDGVRDDSALVHQLGSDQLPEQRLELGIAEIADRPNRSVGEFTSQRRSGLHHRAERGEPVQPGNQ